MGWRGTSNRSLFRLPLPPVASPGPLRRVGASGAEVGQVPQPPRRRVGGSRRRGRGDPQDLPPRGGGSPTGAAGKDGATPRQARANKMESGGAPRAPPPRIGGQQGRSKGVPHAPPHPSDGNRTMARGALRVEQVGTGVKTCKVGVTPHEPLRLGGGNSSWGLPSVGLSGPLPGRRPPLLSLADGAWRLCGVRAAASTRPSGWLAPQVERGQRNRGLVLAQEATLRSTEQETF